MVRRWQDEREIGIVNLFGSNEGAALVSAPRDIGDPEERARLFPRFGVPGLGWPPIIGQAITTRLVDPMTGQLVEEPNRPGELFVKGPSVISHYYADAELDSRAFDADGFFHTGDLFAIESWPSGRPDRYRFVGRARELIIRGGMNVSPEEIEQLLAEHPSVAEVAVVGVRTHAQQPRTCARSSSPSRDTSPNWARSSGTSRSGMSHRSRCRGVSWSSMRCHVIHLARWCARACESRPRDAPRP